MQYGTGTGAGDSASGSSQTLAGVNWYAWELKSKGGSASTTVQRAAGPP